MLREGAVAVEEKEPCKLALVYHPDFALHGYPVLRDRVEPAWRELEARGLVGAEGVKVLEPRPAEEEWVERVHAPGHIRAVKESGYWETALLSAGSVMLGAEETASGRSLNSFCFVGAAGHHAGREGFWGFCYLNDVAMAVEYLRSRGMRGRFAVLDVDPHYGDGTRDILGPDREVMHVNFHSGAAVGEKNGPFCFDVALPYDASDELFLEAVARNLERLESFRPLLLFVVFEHDSHDDDYGAFRLSDEAYGSFARLVKKAFPRGVCYVLSGGSNPRVAVRAIGDVVEVLSE